MVGQRNATLVIILNSLRGCIFILPVLVPYYQHQLGLSFEDFLIGEIAFAVVMIALEVPSGWISDVWNRKHVLALSFVFEIVGWALLYNADTLWLAAVAQGVIGIGTSLFSGTDSAILYDSLLEQKREHAYRALYSRSFAYSFYALALSALAGGVLYAMDPYLPLHASVAACVIGLGISLFLREPVCHKRAVSGNALADMASSVIFAIRQRPEIGSMMLYWALLMGATKVLFWCQQPFYELVGVPVALFGVLTAVGSVTSGLAGQWGHKLDEVIRPRYVIYALGWVCVASTFILAMAPNMWTLALLFSSPLAFGFFKPAMGDYLNKRVSSERRATLLSANNLGSSLVFIPVSLIAGRLETQGGVTDVLLFLGIFLLLAKLLYVALPHARRKVMSML